MTPESSTAAIFAILQLIIGDLKHTKRREKYLSLSVVDIAVIRIKKRRLYIYRHLALRGFCPHQPIGITKPLECATKMIEIAN
jgi:hypothetical protein